MVKLIKIVAGRGIGDHIPLIYKSLNSLYQIDDNAKSILQAKNMWYHFTFFKNGDRKDELWGSLLVFMSI